MIVNGVTVPDPSSTVQFIQDPIGGFTYRVTTSVVVQALTASDLQTEQNNLIQQRDAAQANLNIITPQVTTFVAAVDAVNAAVSVSPTPISPTPIQPAPVTP